MSAGADITIYESQKRMNIMDNQEMGRTVSPDEREREIVLNISVLRKDFRRLLKKFWWIVILAAVLMAELFYVRAYAGYVPM